MSGSANRSVSCMCRVRVPATFVSLPFGVDKMCNFFANMLYVKWKTSHFINACLMQVVGNSSWSICGNCFFFNWSIGFLGRVVHVTRFIFRWEHPCNSCSCRTISTLPRETQESRPNKSTAAGKGGSYIKGNQGKIQELYKRPKHQPCPVGVEKLFSPVLCYVLFALKKTYTCVEDAGGQWCCGALVQR